MEKVKALLKRTFELLVKKRWLKEIDRAVDRYEKAKTTARYEHYVLAVLLDRYKKRYGEDLRGGNYGRIN